MNPTTIDSKDLPNHLTLSQIAALIPGRPSPAKLIRWHRAGVKGVKLQLVPVGGRYFGTAEWVEEFLAAQRDPRAGPVVESPRARKRRVSAEIAELRRMGMRAPREPRRKRA